MAELAKGELVISLELLLSDSRLRGEGSGELFALALASGVGGS